MADIEVEVFTTRYYKHAYEHTLLLEKGKYNGIICCSGDGIIHEVINAIMHKEDHTEFMEMTPIGIIPGGSGNALSKNICEESEEVCNAENCTFIIAKGECKYIDLMEIERYSSEQKVYAFLSVAWGLIADVDLESEK